MAGTVRARKEGALGWIEFDHPERRNAISAEMWRQIPVAASDLDDDPEVRVVILRGSGDVAFAAGADISEFGKNRTGESAQEYDRENARAMEALADIRKPVHRGDPRLLCRGGLCHRADGRPSVRGRRRDFWCSGGAPGTRIRFRRHRDARRYGGASRREGDLLHGSPFRRPGGACDGARQSTFFRSPNSTTASARSRS